MEVSFTHDVDESWDQVARSLLLSVKTLVSPSRQTKAFPSVPFHLEGTSLKFKMGFSSADSFLQISEQLKHLSLAPSMSSKRIKRSVATRWCPTYPLPSDHGQSCHFLLVAAFRLSGGVLYILWLQVGQNAGGQEVHRAVHSALPQLIATDADARLRHSRAVIMSLSIAGTGELFGLETGR